MVPISCGEPLSLPHPIDGAWPDLVTAFTCPEGRKCYLYSEVGTQLHQPLCPSRDRMGQFPVRLL